VSIVRLYIVLHITKRAIEH